MYQDLKEKFKALETQLSDPGIVNNLPEFTRISKEHSNLKTAYELILELEKVSQQLADNEEMVKTESDPEIKKIAEEELAGLNEKIKVLQIAIEEELHPANPNDKKDAIIEIRAALAAMNPLCSPPTSFACMPALPNAIILKLIF
jgi:peptide chain release factor 1